MELWSRVFFICRTFGRLAPVSWKTLELFPNGPMYFTILRAEKEKPTPVLADLSACFWRIGSSCSSNARMTAMNLLQGNYSLTCSRQMNNASIHVARPSLLCNK